MRGRDSTTRGSCSPSPGCRSRSTRWNPIYTTCRDAAEPGITPDDLRQRLAAELTTGKTVLSLTATASSADEAHQLATRWLQSFSEAVHAYVSRRVDQALLEAEANLAAVRSGWTSIGEMLHMAPGIQEQSLGI